MSLTFSHSGNLGDIVWGLSVVKQLGPGEFHIKLENLPHVIRKYNNGPVYPEYENRLSKADLNIIAPLLESQPYISTVVANHTKKIDYDLDHFRATVGSVFKTNFIETYAQTFNIPYDIDGSFNPWIYVVPKNVAKFVVTRTSRYHSNKTTTIPTWLKLLRENKIADEGIFVGLPQEHADFQDLFNINIPYHPTKDLLELAQVIAGADVFIGNQTMAYGLAQGLGKQTILELRSAECYIPLARCHYF